MEKKLSIVVPYRNREEHLKQFVPYMEEYLAKEKIPFHIYIIHQADDKPFNRAKLLNVGYKESEEFKFNEWGIAEPTSNEIVEPSIIDAVIVPLIGFDLRGHRIGYGKGFYDKYFENYPKHRPRIGVCYFEPLSNIEDTHEFDVPLTHCITPWNSYEF